MLAVTILPPFYKTQSFIASVPGVEAVSFKGRRTIAKPSLGRPLLPAISDADISIDFQFELKDSKVSAGFIVLVHGI